MKGHLRERTKGHWWAVVDIGEDPETGKRRQKWHKLTAATKKKAQDELNKLLTEMATGAYVAPSALTVGEYLARWLEGYAKPNVAAQTYQRYEVIIRLHLTPALGAIKLSKLHPMDIQRCHAEALESGRKDGRGQALSARTVTHHHRVLREALEQAVRWQILPRNPADSVQPPRPVDREMQTLTAPQVDALLRAAEGTRFQLPILLAVGTGMRRGEVLALRWQDVDLVAGALAVRRSMERTKAGLGFKAPKTGKGTRTITLPAVVVQALRRHLGEQARERELLGPDYADGDLVCARPDGLPISPDNLSRDFTTLLKRHGMPAIRFHDLRHTHATLLLQGGINPKVISERLGHSTVRITLDVYAHVMPSMQEEAARRFDGILSQGAPMAVQMASKATS